MSAPGSAPDPDAPAQAERSAGEIVVAHDGRSGGLDALALAATLAARSDSVLATVVVPFPPNTIGDPPIHADPGARDWEELCASLRKHGEELLREEAVPRLAGLEVGTSVSLDDSPARGLMLLCEQIEPDLLVLGSSHRGLVGRVLPGTTVERMLAGAPCPVAIAPSGYTGAEGSAISRIGVGFDGSPSAARALAEGARLAVRLDASLEVISVVPPLTQRDAPRAAIDVLAGHGVLGRNADRLRTAALERIAELPQGLDATVGVGHGDPYLELRARSETGLDLLVIGSRGYGPLRRVLLGSVSARLVRDCRCPLIVTT